MRKFIVLALTALLPLSTAEAQETYSTAPLSQLLTRTATRLSDRINEIGVPPEVHCELQTEGGLDLNSTRRFFFNPLLVHLTRNHHFSLSGDSATIVRLRVSADQHRVWVIGTIENSTLVGPSPFVISQLLTDELKVALGAHAPRGPSLQWKVHPIGTVRSELLDFCVTDNNPEDTHFDLAVLDTSGVQLFRYNENGNRLSKLVGHAFANASGVWPRIVTGWLEVSAPNELTATTSRGDSLVVNLLSHRATIPRRTRIPLRQSSSNSRSVVWGKHQIGSPNIQGPLQAGNGKPPWSSRDGFPQAFRDAHPDQSNSKWYWVTPTGELHATSTESYTGALLDEKIGDRILIADLNGDGQPELIHSRPTLVNEPDSLIVRSLPTPNKESTIQFKTPLGGGSIVAMDILRRHSNQRPGILVAEQTNANEHRMWILEATQ